ncbi:MAG: hypothetical protein RR710_04180 [Oscillospiraceae bacterium]
MQKIDISQIIIPDNFKNNLPSTSKLASKYGLYKMTHELRDSIIIDENGILINGYITYLLAKMLDINILSVEII